jgi:hypothetical protein
MNSYELSRNWFDWCFDNPEKIKPVHTAIYFFSIEHCNRLGWMPKFGLPTEMVKSAIGIHSYNTYIDALNDLVEWGFIKMVQKSKNQYSSNIIALSNFDKATTKALDKAMIKHSTKQGESIDSINKQINKEQENKETSDFDLAFESFIEMRTKGKNTITDRAIELIKMKLNKLAPEDEAKKILILNQSVMNNWKDVYDLKKESKTDSEPHWKSFAR